MKKWIQKIERAKKKLDGDFKTWAEKAEKHYYNDKDDIDLPIYHSMVQVQRSALYAQPPIPEIRGRNSEVIDPLSREISKVLEKVISYNIDQSDFHSDAKRAVLDFIVTDMGVCRVKIKTKNVAQKDEAGQPMMGEDEQPLMAVGSQSVFIDHWPWKRFVYDMGKDWEECDWICYLHFFTPKELKDEYGVDGQKGAFNNDEDGKCTVYEVWDKKKRQVIHLMSGKEKPLRVKKDPLRLKGFFDCHKPMIANMRSDKYIPLPEFKQICEQLDEINEIVRRRRAIRKSIKDVGFYDKSLKELAGLQSATDGKLLPVDGLRELLGTNGVSNFDAMIAKLPIIQQAQVAAILKDELADIKEQIYEITGLSDIVRGATKASETATAQQIKGQWASIRLQDKQSTINQWLKGILRIMAEIIAEHFLPEQIQMITGVEITPEMAQTMQSDVLRCYAIEIETDSTIQADEAQDKQDRMEMINTVVPLLQNLLPAASAGQIPMDLVKSILVTSVKGYKYARGLEDMINSIGDNMSQLQQFQQQIQQMQQQGEQMQMQMQQVQADAQAQVQQANQYAGQLQQELDKINMQEEQRKNIDVQAEVAKDYADTEKKKAETAKIWHDIQQPVNVAQDPYQVGL